MSYDGPPPQEPPFSGQPSFGGQPQFGADQGPNHPRAAPALICGILGLVLCGLVTGIPAIVMGNRAVREIDASQGWVQGRGMAKAAVIIGWISVAWSVLILLLVIASGGGNN
jgi:Domain of unknown function (DUF4190)